MDRLHTHSVSIGLEVAGEFENFCKAEGIQICPILSETMAAFTERTTRYLQTIFCLYMDDYENKYIHKLSQLVTTLTSRKHHTLDLITKNFNKSDLCPFCTTNH